MHGAIFSLIFSFSNRFTVNLPGNLAVKELENRLRFVRFDRILVTSLRPHFLAHHVDDTNTMI